VYEGSANWPPMSLPLSESDLVRGSCALGPCIESASFVANGRPYVLNAKIGLNAWGTAHKLLEMIRSIAPS
jgi:hypothetical protein